MSITRRAGFGLALLAAPAMAQTWPTRQIRLIVPFPPGGASDIIARLMAPHLAEQLGQQVVVDNRTGANGQIAAEHVARSAADGYTLFMGNAGPSALSQALIGARLPYDSVRDFSFISLVSDVPMAIAVHPSIQAEDLQQLLGLARTRPGQISYGHGGTGAAPHLAMEQIAHLSGTQFNSVPFRGGALAMAAVMGNQVNMIVDTAPVVLPQIRDGRVRGIAITSAERSPQAPGLRTVAEQGFPGWQATSWGGIQAPANLPEPIIARVQAAVVAVMARADVQETLARQGVIARSSTPAAFRAHVEREVARWTEVVRVANIRPD